MILRTKRLAWNIEMQLVTPTGYACKEMNKDSFWCLRMKSFVSCVTVDLSVFFLLFFPSLSLCLPSFLLFFLSFVFASFSLLPSLGVWMSMGRWRNSWVHCFIYSPYCTPHWTFHWKNSPDTTWISMWNFSQEMVRCFPSLRLQVRVHLAGS